MTPVAQSPKGEFRQVAIQPLSLLPGDIVQQVGNQLVVTRNCQVVATRDLTAESTSAPLTIQDAQTVSKALFFKEYPVAGVVVTLIDVVKNTANNSVTFKFSNGDQREFASLEQAIIETNYIHTQPTLAQDILVAKSVALSPDGTDLHQLVGVKCAVDVNATQPVTVQ